jgi:hypothetical protein
MIANQFFKSFDSKSGAPANAELGSYLVALGQGLQAGTIILEDEVETADEGAPSVGVMRNGTMWGLGIDANFVQAPALDLLLIEPRRPARTWSSSQAYAR